MFFLAVVTHKKQQKSLDEKKGESRISIVPFLSSTSLPALIFYCHGSAPRLRTGPAGSGKLNNRDGYN